MRGSTNPIFKSIDTSSYYSDTQATYAGITSKTVILLLIAVISGMFSRFIPVDVLMPLIFVSAITSFICVFIAVRGGKGAPIAGIIYALGEGLVLGILTTILETYYHGIATAAILATATIFLVMLLLYTSGIVKGGSKLNKILFTSLISVILLNLVIFISRLFTPTLYELFYGNGAVAILFSVLLIVLGAFMLVRDFERCKDMVSMGVDRNYEWSLSVGLMVSLVWIYVEVLRLLLIIMRKNK